MIKFGERRKARKGELYLDGRTPMDVFRLLRTSLSYRHLTADRQYQAMSIEEKKIAVESMHGDRKVHFATWLIQGLGGLFLTVWAATQYSVPYVLGHLVVFCVILVGAQYLMTLHYRPRRPAAPLNITVNRETSDD